MTTVEKFSSAKATIECRFNAVTQRYRCHVLIGQKRIGPLYAAGNEAEPDAAARQVLARAVEQGRIDADDIETDDDGAPVVHAEGAKGKATAATAKAPTAKAKAQEKAPAATAKAKAPAATAKPAARTTTTPKRSAAPMGEAKTQEVIGNGEETRALEDAYFEAKEHYHEVGDALKERHLAVAAVAAQPL